MCIRDSDYMGYKLPSIIITGTTLAESIQHVEQINTQVLYKPLKPEALKRAMIVALNQAIY